MCYETCANCRWCYYEKVVMSYLARIVQTKLQYDIQKCVTCIGTLKATLSFAQKLSRAWYVDDRSVRRLTSVIG